MLLAEFVDLGAGVRVAAPPKLFDEGQLLVFGGQLPEDVPLLGRDDVGHISFEPSAEGILFLFVALPLNRGEHQGKKDRQNNAPQ